MNTHLHLEEALQRDIDMLRLKVLEMARLTERALTSSVEALARADRRLAYSVILRDQYIDERETELDRLSLEFLVRHQPAGGHLRLVFTTIQVNRELERIGDYAESIARQALVISVLTPQPSFLRVVELGDLAVHMLRDGVQAFLDLDAELARRTMTSEERANNLRDTLNAGLAEASARHEISGAAITPLATVVRRLERAADQVKNLCEDVLYLCTGEFVRHKSTEGFHILFFDMDNACLSQMAEAIGNALRLPQIRFDSAGAAPQILDSRTVEFLTGRALDISGAKTKKLDAVSGWEHCQLIVVLGEKAQEVVPAHPNKTIVLTWAIPDPREKSGLVEDWRTTFESAARLLESNIRELAEAILDEPQTDPQP